jgi:hypothetical protein
MLREFIESLLLSRASMLSDAPDARLRLALVGSHMIGLVFARSVVGVSELAAAGSEHLVAAVAPVVQHYLTAPDLTLPVG